VNWKINQCKDLITYLKMEISQKKGTICSKVMLVIGDSKNCEFHNIKYYLEVDDTLVAWWKEENDFILFFKLFV
jgi:hypothetical protein